MALTKHWFAWGIMATFLALSGASAQPTKPAPGPTTKPAEPAPSTVMGTLDNKTLTYGDLQMFKKFFVPRGADDERLITLWKLNTHLADQARKQNLQNDPTIKPILEMAFDQILTRALIRKKQMDNPVTDAEIKEYYEQHKNDRQYRESDLVTGRILAVEKKDEADKIKAELVKGKDFDEAATEHAEQTQKTTGLSTPEIKNMTREQLYKVVGQVAWSMTTATLNEVIGPRQFNKGWVLFKVTERQPGKPLPFEKVQVDIKELLQRKKTADIQSELIKQAEKATGTSYLGGQAGQPQKKTVIMKGDP